ncbi:anthranilate phosphoribosyltransferase [Abditibacterium utsteinense]|uniref:Anthranilate phosphoribosyltransferase n=1 Tax=Abditibacterium utsteinense TaxID=1960156 RepID=A0A2S8SV36_9BACT|nr:anthranilate phosphoribosyltransferase [Abditibacterium utsteinense]PQV64668.1 anthranilate phosphoribosyltransferase [Abditibacterium utsteinense]
MNVSQALKSVSHGEILSEAEAEAVLSDIVDNAPSQLQVAALLGILRGRGESVSELTGFARALRNRVIAVKCESFPLIDTCGTGGDAPKVGAGTFNISTAASLIASAAGAVIAKHGNRAVSSKSGSADVLEALGVHLELSPEAIARGIDEIGIGFMFAPNHHPAMKEVAPLRRELGIRTVFNLLGPLSNPANATRQIMGVPASKWLRPIAETLLALGCERAFVVHSEDGLDEFSTCAPTDFLEIRDGKILEHRLEPDFLDLACLDAKHLSGGDAAQNATIIQQILHDGEGPSADIACLNAAAILLIADLTDNWPEALKLSRATVSSGAAREKLAQLQGFTEQYAA